MKTLVMAMAVMMALTAVTVTADSVDARPLPGPEDAGCTTYAGTGGVIVHCHNEYFHLCAWATTDPTFCW